MTKVEEAKKLLLQGYDSVKVKELVPCSRTTVWKAQQELEKEKGIRKPEVPIIEVAEEPVEKPEYIEEPEPEIAKPEEGIITPEVLEKAERGALTPEDVTQIFIGVNDMLPKQHRRSKEACEVCGTVWCAPVNRILAQYAEENADLIWAIFTTILVFVAPILVSVWKERAEAEKEEEKRPKKTKA